MGLASGLPCGWSLFAEILVLWGESLWDGLSHLRNGYRSLSCAFEGLQMTEQDPMKIVIAYQRELFGRLDEFFVKSHGQIRNRVCHD